MLPFQLIAEKLSKEFTPGKKIFSGIDFELKSGEILGIFGPNGSGKTTLLKILTGLLKPTDGNIRLLLNDKLIINKNIHSHIGFVAPYMNLYEEFAPLELLKIFAGIRGIKFDIRRIDELMTFFALENMKNERISAFSSGMKQRLKYILALQAQSEMLFFDEPMTNLDEMGIRMVREIISFHIADGGSVIIASNDEREKELCGKIVQLGSS